jgi:UDP-N-acetylmuramoylalanine--D-glutamate ligase
LTFEEIQSGVETFLGVEGRLQFLGEIRGIKIYNDNNATTPEATLAALNALTNDGFTKSIILIIGGADKGLDMSQLISVARQKCKKIILLAGTGTEKIKNDLPNAPVFESLTTAVDAAFAAAQKDDTILFSPAFASFGMFKNEYDRNDQFVRLFRKHSI